MPEKSFFFGGLFEDHRLARIAQSDNLRVELSQRHQSFFIDRTQLTLIYSYPGALCGNRKRKMCTTIHHPVYLSPPGIIHQADEKFQLPVAHAR